ncbi:phospholipase effector Tle1 domain-containing protein [Streptomyces sp. NPDC056512]|uniref:phospholipase effector Tle1 domain-containing protein n=1 Tax=Streptomyces sp. NPDC056512 TaxID=3345846 RepID=UPI0036AE9510
MYVFGFSRSAYTACALVGMLNKPGLMRPGSKNLVPYAVAKYAFNHGIHESEEEVAHFSHAFCRRTEHEPLWPDIKRNDPQQVSHKALPVAYLGVWDTVKTAGVLRLSSLRWPHTRRLPDAACIRHALSLYEKQRPFLEFPVTPRSDSLRDTGQEVWFAGMHSDVGGTFPYKNGESLLSMITLKWITDGVCEDLIFRDGAYTQA